MDENDVIVIDTRNATRVNSAGPGIFGARPPVQQRSPVIITQAQPQQVYAQPQPAYMHQPAQSGTVYVRDPATGALVREPVGGVAPTVGTKLGALGTGKLIGIGVQVLSLLMPLPTAPGATGDLAKDVRNGQLYAEAVAMAQQRYDRLNTIGALIGQVA